MAPCLSSTVYFNYTTVTNAHFYFLIMQIKIVFLMLLCYLKEQLQQKKHEIWSHKLHADLMTTLSTVAC